MIDGCFGREMKHLTINLGLVMNFLGQRPKGDTLPTKLNFRVIFESLTFFDPF